MREMPPLDPSPMSGAVKRGAAGGVSGFASSADLGSAVEPSRIQFRARRFLPWLALTVAVVIGAAFALAMLQSPQVPRWGPEPSAFSWAGFTAPREINRWQRPEDRLKGWLSSVRFAPDGQTALVVGDDGHDLLTEREIGIVLRSGDGGRRWSAVASATKATLQSVALSADGRTALAVGEGGKLLRSDDGGQRWSEVLDVTKERLTSVAFALKSRTALAVGSSGAMLRSEDGGQRWSDVGGATKAWLESVAFASDDRTALAVGSDGTVLRSADGGQRWSEVPRTTNAWLFSVAFASDGGAALAVGQDGTVLWSDDRGRLWGKASGTTKAWLRSVAFAPVGLTALAVGGDGTVLRSTNGGLRWSLVDSVTRAGLDSVSFAPDGRRALAVGQQGTVLRSDDGGQRWALSAFYEQQPANWFWALTLLVALSAVASAFRYVSLIGASSSRRGLLDNGVSDQPITSESQDRLAFGPVVAALSAFLRHAATRPSLAIAVNAPWGMGKSSFMHLLTERLKDLGARPVWFNVWHHQHEEVLLAPLLQAITQQAIPRLSQWRGWVFRGRLLIQRWRHPDWGVWLGTAALASVPAYAVCLFLRSGDNPDERLIQRMADRCVRDLHRLFDALTGGQWIATAKSGGLGDLLAAALKALRDDAANGWIVLVGVLLIWCWFMLIQYLMRPFPSSPAILLAGLNKRFSLSQAEAQTDFRQRFRRHFGDVACALQPRTMTIFIDDLDRCKPDKAAELLEAVNYLSEAGPCFVVLGIAREIVEAQVASAHKTLAEEQAAMWRARRDEEPLPVDAARRAQADKDRLRYARKYLRKLVQLDVNLPTLKSEEAMRLLLDRSAPEASKKEAPGSDAKPIARALRRLRAWAARWVERLLWLKWGVPLALVVAFSFQVVTTVRKMEEESAKSTVQLRAKVKDVRKDLEDARGYDNWLRRMADAKASVAGAGTPDAKKVSAQRGDAKPNADRTGALLFKAQADVVALYIKAMEQALPLLEHEAEVGNTKTFDAIRKAKVDVARAAVEDYTASMQLNRQGSWKEIREGLVPAAVRAARPAPAALAGAASGRADRPPERPTGGGGGATPEAGIPWWALELGMLPVLALLLWAWRAKDSYTVEATPEYIDAVTTWQQQLLKNPETATPRELKRFLNLSRYAVTRLRPEGAKPGDPTALSEHRIVEFTAKWQLARSRDATADLRAALISAGPDAAPGWTPPPADEVELFLGIVGDIDTGEPEPESEPAAAMAA